MAQLNYVDETQTMRRISRDPLCFIRYTTHALERMAERGIIAADVESVLTKGQVVLIEMAKQDILWRAIGRDIDGRKLEILAHIEVDEIKIKIVTAF